MADQTEIHILVQSEDEDERKRAAEEQNNNFAILKNKEQAWEDLIRLTQDKNDNVRSGAANSFGTCYSHLPPRKKVRCLHCEKVFECRIVLHVGSYLNSKANYCLIIIVAFLLPIILFAGIVSAAYPTASDITIQGSVWRWVPVKIVPVGGYGYDDYYPVMRSPDNGTIEMDTPFNSEAYIDRDFIIPTGTSSLSLEVFGARNIEGWCGDPVSTTVSLIDSKNNFHQLGNFVPVQRDGHNIGPGEIKIFETSSFGGQRVKIRISQTSSGQHCTDGFYRNINLTTSSLSLLSTNAFAETNVTVITIVTDSSWKVIDTNIEGWTSIDFDDSYWVNAKIIVEDPQIYPEKIIYPETPTALPFYYRKTFYLSGTKIISGMLFDSTPCEVVYVFRTCTPPTYYVNGNVVGLLEKKEIMPDYPSQFSLLNDIKQYLKLGKNVIAVIATSDSNGKIASTTKIRIVSPSPSPTPTSTPTPTPTPTSTATPTPPSPTPSPLPESVAAVIAAIYDFIDSLTKNKFVWLILSIATLLGGFAALKELRKR